MRELILAHEAALRIGMFTLIFVTMGLWEFLAPRRALSLGRRARWPANLVILGLDIVLVRLLVPIAALGMSELAEEHSFGLLQMMHGPGWLKVIVAVLVLDLVIYGQHKAFHVVPVLWWVHRTHHVDLDIDVTTGARFHPIEIIVSMFIKLTVVGLLGAPVLAVFLFETLLSSGSMFNHSNAYLAPKADRWLRWFIVTPDMHRIHHSTRMCETDSNYGFSFSCWDRMFGTYTEYPELGHEAMHIGVRDFSDKRTCATLGGMLKIPFMWHSNPRS